MQQESVSLPIIGFRGCFLLHFMRRHRCVSGDWKLIKCIGTKHTGPALELIFLQLNEDYLVIKVSTELKSSESFTDGFVFFLIMNSDYVHWSHRSLS